MPALSKVGLAFLLAFTGLLSGIGGSPIGQAEDGFQDLRSSLATSGDVERSGNSGLSIAKELNRFRTSDADDGDGDLPDVVSDITLDPNHFSPNGDGVHDTTDIRFKVNSSTQYFSLDVYDRENLDWKGTIIETSNGIGQGSYIVRGWDGTVMDLHGEHLLSEGVYFVIPWHGDVSISPIVSQQSPFVIDVTAPVSNLDDPPITVQGETGTISGQIVSDLMIDIYGDYQGIRVYASYDDDNGSKSVDGEIAEDGSFQIEVPVKRGENTFNVYVEDLAMNGSLEPAHIVEYDHVVQEPPAAPSAVDTPASQYVGAQVTLTWSESDDWGSGQNRSYDVQLYDGGNWRDIVTDYRNTTWTGNLPEDVNTREARIRVRAKSEHGASDYTQSGTFRIGAPDRPTVNSYPEITNAATVMIEGMAEEGAKVEIIRGDDTFIGTADDQTGAFQIEVSLLENQHNTLTIQAVADDLIGKPVEIDIVHDSIPPSNPTITVEPSGWTNDEAVTVTITEGDDDLSGVERTEYLIEEEEHEALSVQGTWQTYTDSIDITDEGVTTVYARTLDRAGNSSTVVEAVVQIDRTAPTLTLIGDNPMKIAVGSDYVELGATAEDNVDGDISEQIEITGEVDTSTIGSYDVTYSVTDRAGNKVSVTRIVTVEDSEGPTNVNLTVIDRTTDSITLGLSAFDPSGIKEYILHRDGQQIAIIDGGATTYTDTGLESGQAYTYTVVASDPFGNTSETASLTVTTEGAVKPRPDDDEQGVGEQDDDKKKPSTESNGKQERVSSKLPKTASQAYTWLLFGTVLLALATALNVYRRRRIN